MNKTLLHTLLFILILFAWKPCDAQTCTIAPSAFKVCLGSSVSFIVTPTGVIKKATWAFGDGTKDTLINPAHVYNTPGTYNVSITVIFTNNVTFTTTVTQPVKVFDLPKIGFNIIGNDSICMSAQLCLNSTSTPGSSGAPIRKTSFLFGDGTPVINITSPCHKYSKTGNFILTLEIEDTNGCIARLEKSVWVFDSVRVTILPYINNCAPVRLINASNISSANVKRFYWDFGDGVFDSVNFSLAQHLYADKSKCPYKVRLYIESKFGCSDEQFVTVCPFYFFDIHIFADKHTACYHGNVFNFESIGNNPNTSYSWGAKPLGSATAILGGPGYKYTFKFDDCGKYVVFLYLRNGFCDTTVYDTVNVLGPVARIEKDTILPYNIINKYQCSPDDTTYFVSPTLYQSSHCSSSIKRLWDFGDAFCPQCTTDTKKGININTNCRWSKDSDYVKHKYSDTGCYTVQLILVDTVTGCSDTDTKIVVIMKPDLSKLKITGRPCLNELQYVDVSLVKPSCDAQEFWFNVDTICNSNKQAWYIRKSLKNFYFPYYGTCNGNKVVSAFVLRNGNCYDTLYYPLTFPKLHTAFELDKRYGCPDLTVRASLLDSIQSSATKAVWEWGDGTITNDTIIGGIIHSQVHTFNHQEVYQIVLHLYDTAQQSNAYPHVGCLFDTTYYLPVGFFKTFRPDMNICAKRTVRFMDSVFYYRVPYKPNTPFSNYSWGTNPKEKIYWYFGDGSIDSGSAPTHIYPKAGKYKVTMVAIDSTGCIDSIVSIIGVNDFYIDFGWKPTVLVCGQIVQFADSSYVIDSSGVGVPDKIVTWDWDFGDNRIHSNLKNPAHPYFVYGTFKVKLIIETLKGCIDSIEKEVYIEGPQPKFEFITDTIGCVPYTIKLRNISVHCQQNIIYMGDAGNSNFVLKQGDTLTYTYTKPGIYILYLFGESTVFNPNTGTNVYCSAWFPEKNNPNVPLMRVIVLARPPVSFEAPDTICVNTLFPIINTSDKIYTSYKWDYGDSTSGSKFRPDTNTTHLYQDTGVYYIKLSPYYTPLPNLIACPDTFVKKIVVTTLKADFSMDTMLMPLIIFKNESQYADSYYWNFGHPQSGSKNYSTIANPQHDFLNDTGTFNICLVATNKFGCKDTVCKDLINTAYKLVVIPNVFTINNDGLNDAFDISIHGEIFYDLTIFNRWGEGVYKSIEDGIDNDGINWNGSINNTGPECMDGIYYVLFRYQFRGEEIKTYKGSVTLIRK